MDRGTRRAISAVAIGLFVGASAGAAQAASRYAAPSARGSGDCSSPANACTLSTAVSGSSQGDTVQLAGDQGTYGTSGAPISTTIADAAPDAPGAIEGTPGQPRPVIYINATLGFNLTGTATVNGQQQATSVRNLEIDELGTSLPTALSVQGNVDHVIVRSPNSAYDACSPLGLPPPESEVISNTVCVVGSSNGNALGTVAAGGGTPQPYNITLRNDTLYAPGSGARAISFSTGFGVMIGVTAVNVIARGGLADVSANQFNAGGVTIAFDHSNYAVVSQGTGTTITPAGSGSNQTAAPRFANAAGGDFHEATGSPTIDAGVTNPANGTTDLDGSPRTIGLSTDIGAYEAAEAPTLVPAAPTAITPNAATVNVTVNPNFAATTAQAYLGANTKTETPLRAQSAGGGIAPVPLAFLAIKLKPDTTYHYRVVATNAVGSSSTADQTFTTPRSTGRIRISRTAPVRHSKARVRLSCSGGATCSGMLVLKGIGNASFSIAARRTITVAVRVSRRARRRLATAPHHRLKVVASVSRTDGGTAARAKVELTL